ncbi:related to pyridoxamine-phosphate oxidase [Cephalotrichum gorgonifer]|uniref:pyridoxal 5'-phosphate synthase n=1 Tax=Cephalotrichum gorgonifer TaxID=2041049 RepID=A0AAE8N3Y7_9PEZI|nr:related to pyridoxamine-phosphate oxidase [Cephalotrichum gorgonifer]
MADSKQSIEAVLRALPSLKGPFREAHIESLPNTPHEAFRLWFDDAISENIKEPHAMTLSTVDEDGSPDARVVILKNLDSRGWHFSINIGSAKGRQITANNRVAITFYWPQLGRSVRLRGKAVMLSQEESSKSFLDRSIGAKTVAVASKQSQVLPGPDAMRDSLVEAQKVIEENPDYVLPSWKVYALDPQVVEFWQGSTDRLHQRLQYVRGEADGTWEKRNLWP